MNTQGTQFQRAWIRSNKLFNTQIRICQQVEWAQKRTNELSKGRITHQSYRTTRTISVQTYINNLNALAAKKHA